MKFTLQTAQTCTNAFWAAFFCVLALWPCCFLAFAAFSAAFCWDCSFCWPRAIIKNYRIWKIEYVCSLTVKSNKHISLIAAILTKNTTIYVDIFHITMSLILTELLIKNEWNNEWFVITSKYDQTAAKQRLSLPPYKFHYKLKKTEKGSLEEKTNHWHLSRNWGYLFLNMASSLRIQTKLKISTQLQISIFICTSSRVISTSSFLRALKMAIPPIISKIQGA